MTEDLRDRIMRDLSTVDWPDGATIRRRAGRRRARRIVVGCAAVVVAVVAMVWTFGPIGRGDGEPRPADRNRPGPGTLRGEDVGPGYRVGAWGWYGSTANGRDADEKVVGWPPAWLNECPAYAGAPPAGFQGHLGGYSVRMDPSGSERSPSVEEHIVRFPDASAAGTVLEEARQVAEVCPSFTIAGRFRYDAEVGGTGFAGDEAVQLNLTEAGVDHATGGPVGIPGRHLHVLVRVGRVVILLTAAPSTDGPWMRGVARAAVSRLCAGTADC